MMNNAKFVISSVAKSEKKSLYRFYKQHQYSAKYLGIDIAYAIYHQEEIVAAVIASLINEDNNQWLVHGLLVSKSYRQLGLARQLIQFIQDKHSPLICFIQPSLLSFYQTLGFIECDTNQLSLVLQPRFNAYVKKHKSLIAVNFKHD